MSTNPPLVPVLLAAVALAACSSTPDGAAETKPSLRLEVPDQPQQRRSRVGDVELDVWNDPSFRRRFAESYIAESEIEPRVTVVEREQLQEVLELISADRMDEAAALILGMQTPASSAVFDFTLANIHFQQERLGPAADAYLAAVEKYPKFRRAWQNLALIHVQLEEFPEAVKAFTRVISLGGGDAVTYGLLGFAYSNLENHLAAETAYRMATTLDPETLDWKLFLARSLFKQQRFADAVALCDSLIAENPDHADLWMLQAGAFIGMNQPLRAAENYEFVDSLGKATPDSLMMLGDIYVNEELFDVAVDSYVRALELEPEKMPTRAIRAAQALTARNALGDTKRLIAAIESLHGDALGVEDSKTLLRLQARIAVAEGAGDEEARILEEIVALDPLDGEALILLGQHANRGGDVEKAAFYYERAASLDDFEAEAKVRHAQLLVSQARYAEAVPLLERALMLEPDENVREYLEQVERAAQNR